MDKVTWEPIGNMNKGRNCDETAVNSMLKSTDGLSLSVKIFIKNAEGINLKRGDYVFFNFKTFENQPDFVVGNCSLGLGNGKFIDLGSINKGEKCSEKSLSEFKEYAGKAQFYLKVYPGKGTDTIGLNNGDKLYLSFGKKEGEPDFVIGRVLLKK